MKQYISANVLEEATGIKATTLANWRSRKIGPPFVKIEGAVRYPVDEVEAWIKAQNPERVA
ncbi:hypothetical protein CKALI_06465 [Corynebacterium kalinowskii]|uniref:Helix-turn-helix domain-containing protein n=1 Tax=Corynebacterium kalinowskii TaxID=2675216 RepID=A0A6B8VAK1_9CORY|nr:helix-turn-helix domain-containing protein [Corynebacterium kalinowskii]QGU02162.1 hypothetical protein CKALI_06465 [Corynebacterium kalinowskii]